MAEVAEGPWQALGVHLPAKRLQDATRIALGVLVVNVLGLCAIPDVAHWEYARDLSGALQWAGIAIVLVAAPVIGHAAKTGVEVGVGAVAGGIIAYLVCFSTSAAIHTILDGLVAMLSSLVLGALGYELLSKFVTLVFLTVTHTTFKYGQPGAWAISTCAGIIAGVLAIFVLVCLWFPSSASETAIETFHNSLRELQQLTELTWGDLHASKRAAEVQLLMRAVDAAQQHTQPGAAQEQQQQQQQQQRTKAQQQDQMQPGAAQQELQTQSGTAQGMGAGQAGREQQQQQAAANATTLPAAAMPASAGTVAEQQPAQQQGPAQQKDVHPQATAISTSSHTASAQQGPQLSPFHAHNQQQQQAWQQHNPGGPLSDASVSSVEHWLSTVPSLSIPTGFAPTSSPATPVASEALAAAPSDGAAASTAASGAANPIGPSSLQVSGAPIGAPANSTTARLRRANSAAVGQVARGTVRGSTASARHNGRQGDSSPTKSDPLPAAGISKQPSAKAWQSRPAAGVRGTTQLGGDLPVPLQRLSNVSGAATILDSNGQSTAAGQAGEQPPLSPAERAKQRQQADNACEATLIAIYDDVRAATAALQDAEREILVGTLCGHRLYLPLLLLGKRGKHHMPALEFDAALHAVMRTARLVWTLHHTLQQIFDSQMLELLEARYPIDLLDKLHSASVAFVADCVAAVQRHKQRQPWQPLSPVHLVQCHRIVDALMHITEMHWHQILDHVRRYRAGSAPHRHNSLSEQSARFSFSDPAVDDAANEDQLSIGDLTSRSVLAMLMPRMWQQQEAECAVSPAFVPWQAEQENQQTQPMQKGQPLQEEKQPQEGQQQQKQDAEARQQGRQGAQQGQQRMAAMHEASDTAYTAAAQTPQSPHDAAAAGPTGTSQQQHAQQWQPNQQPHQQTKQQHHGAPPPAVPAFTPPVPASTPPVQACTPSVAGSRVRSLTLRSAKAAFGSMISLVPSFSGPNSQALAALRAHGSTAAAPAAASASEIELQLPHIAVTIPPEAAGKDEPASACPAEGPASPGTWSVESVAPLQRDYQHIDTPRLFFPDSREGFNAKVKWYSFQLLMHQVLHEFDNLLACMNALMPHLPGAAV